MKLSFSDDLTENQNTSSIHGYAGQETAYRIHEPYDMTKVKEILQIGLEHRLSETTKVKISGRFFYDAVFDLTNNYPDAVRRDQETEAVFRETYLEVSLGDSNLTVGKQQIVWGEVPGLFFADIVSAKDLREFFLTSFEYIRIPQWALNYQYFGRDSTLQLVWLPVQEFDKLPKAGSEFALNLSIPAGQPYILNDEQKPSASLENSGGGIRWSTLIDGWNPALFYFYKYDSFPAYFRSVESDQTISLTPDHTRIHQIGYTLSKDFEVFVLKSEGVLSIGKMFQVQDMTSGNGLTKKDFFEYVLGGEFSPFQQTSINLQVYQRIIRDHDSDMVDPAIDSGASVWLNMKGLRPSLDSEILLIYDFRNHDWMFKPKVIWGLSDSLSLAAGIDFFGGNNNGFFGQFSGKRRVYTELRYNF